MLSFLPLDALDEILDLIESVSEGFPTYFFNLLPLYLAWRNARLNFSTLPQNGELKPSILIKVYGYTCVFFRHFFKGRKFFELPVCLPGGRTLSKWGLRLKGANSFVYEMIPIYMGDNNENDRVPSSESVPIHFNAL